MNTVALLFALGTVLTWGVYSVMLHMGSVGMKPTGLLEGKPVAPDLLSLRMKAFLLVGVAYFVVAVIIPLIILKVRNPGDPSAAEQLAGRTWVFPTIGWTWSLTAGFAGALGAFFLLMGLSSGRTPEENKILPLLIPAIVFAGAPIVNALVSTTKEGNWQYANWKFFLGMVMAAAGTYMVMEFKPTAPAPSPAKPAAAAPAAPQTQPESAPKVSQAFPSGYSDVRKTNYDIR